MNLAFSNSLMVINNSIRQDNGNHNREADLDTSS